MKQLFKVAALALCTVSLMSSCCKKKGAEPTPTPTPTPTPNPNPINPPTPVDNSKGIKLTLAAGQTDFSLSSLTGEELSIEGTTAADTKVQPYEKNKTDYKAKEAGKTIVIKGNVKTLVLSAGQFEKLDLSNAPATLEGLQVLDAKVKTFDFTNATGLKVLSLLRTGTSGSYDLSHTKLSTVSLRHVFGSSYKLPQTVSSILVEETHHGIQNDLNLASFPNLVSMRLRGTSFEKPVNFSGSQKLVTFGQSRCQIPTINLSNSPNLKNVLLDDMNGTTEVNLSACPLLVEGAPTNWTQFKGFAANECKEAFATLNLSGASLTKFEYAKFGEAPGLVTLDLSNNKLQSADFSKYGKLKNLNLLGNPTLTGQALTAALGTLPATAGKIKIAGLSAADQAVVTGKGWTIVQ